MLRWLRSIEWGALVGAALVTIFLFGIFSSLPNPPPKSTSEDQQSGQSDKVDAPEYTLGSNEVTAAATTIIALFTIVLVIVTNRQARLTRDSIDLATKEFISTHRPKLRVHSIVITHPVPPSLMPLDIIATGQPIVGHLSISNVGETAADIIESHCHVFWTRDGSLPMERPYERDRLNNRANNFVGNGWLAAGATMVVPFRSADTMGNDAAEYLSLTQGRHIYVMGWIRHRDDAGTIREMMYCRLWRAGEGERFPRFHAIKDSDYERED